MRLLFFAPAAALALLLSGCNWDPPADPYFGPNPADPAAAVSPVTDVSVRGPYQSFRPVQPRSWREQNERVAPQPRP